MVLRLLDHIADAIQHKITTQAQERVAVAVVLLSLPLILLGPLLTTDPVQLLIYEMSAIALTLTGITWLAGLTAKRAVEESTT